MVEPVRGMPAEKVEPSSLLKGRWVCRGVGANDDRKGWPRTLLETCAVSPIDFGSQTIFRRGKTHGFVPPPHDGFTFSRAIVKFPKS